MIEKIKLNAEKQRYTVQLNDGEFFILTKPFNAKNTFIYTLVDLKKGVRGPCDLIFGMPYDLENSVGAMKCMIDLITGKMGISRRRQVPLEPEETRQFIEKFGLRERTEA